MTQDVTLFDPPSGPLGRSVRRGALVTGAAQAVRLACQFASVIILSRLLTPEHFGIVAMAGPVLAFVGLFQDLGLMHATVQKKSITHAEVNALFWINFGVSVVLTLVVLLISPLVSRFYGDPRVGTMVAAMSVLILIYGAGGQHHAILHRRMQFRRIAILDSVNAIVGLAVAVVWALVAPSYWALFAGNLANGLCGTVQGWMASAWRPGAPRWADKTGSLLNYGAGLTGYNFADYFARNLDSILIGRYQGNQALGLYDRAYKLLLFPLQQITNPLSKVMLPALSRMLDEPHRYRHAFLRVASISLAVTLPGVACAIAMADVLVPFALGAKWAGSAVIFKALGFAGMLQTLNSLAGWLFTSQGRTMAFMRWGIFTAATSIAAFVIGLPYGAFGVALGYAISEYLRTPLLWIYSGRSGPVSTGDAVRVAAPFMIGAHLAVGALWMLRPLLPQEPLAALLLSAALGYLMVFGFAALFPAGRATLRDGFALLAGRRPDPAQG